MSKRKQLQSGQTISKQQHQSAFWFGLGIGILVGVGIALLLDPRLENE